MIRSVLTSSFTVALAFFFSLASLDSFSVSRTSCLMNPPGMTERSRGGADGGGARSSSRICLQEQKLGYGAARGHAPQPSQPRGDISGTSVWGQLSRAPSPALPVQELCRLPARPPRLARGCCTQQEAKCWEEKPLVLPRAEQLQPGHPGWAAGGQGAADGVRTRRALRAGPDRSPSQHRASQAACLLPRRHAAAAAPSTKPCRLPPRLSPAESPQQQGNCSERKIQAAKCPEREGLEAA